MSEQPDDAELAEFRKRAAAWIAANRPADPGFKLPQTFLEVESKRQFEFLRQWQARLYAAGLLGFDVPREYGGQGVSPAKKQIVSELCSEHQTPFMVNLIALQWAGPTILAYGTEEQKKRDIPRILSADDIWCQGFSEPEAGSDLASLATRAQRTQDGYLVTGHKVWTTLAHFAQHMILLARTDPDAHKYQGLSYFLFPMGSQGVTIQPLTKMTGEGGFNQVIFDDAPMPADCILGSEGQGWQIAMSTLMLERGAAEQSARHRTASLFAQLNRIVELARATPRVGRRAIDDPVIADRIAQLTIEAHAIAYGAVRGEVPSLNQERPMALPLMNKIVSSEWNQRLTDLACDILGPAAALWVDDPNAPDGGMWPRAFMNSFGMTIGGGTSQILRNIIGERVLGLPKSK